MIYAVLPEFLSGNFGIKFPLEENAADEQRFLGSILGPKSARCCCFFQWACLVRVSLGRPLTEIRTIAAIDSDHYGQSAKWQRQGHITTLARQNGSDSSTGYVIRKREMHDS
jgi:hypothetical protein